MLWKAKKEAPTLPKAEVKERALKVKEAVLKGVHSNKKRNGKSPSSAALKTTQISLKEHPKKNKLYHCALIKFLLTESAMKMEDNNTLVH